MSLFAYYFALPTLTEETDFLDPRALSGLSDKVVVRSAPSCIIRERLFIDYILELVDDFLPPTSCRCLSLPLLLSFNG